MPRLMDRIALEQVERRGIHDFVGAAVQQLNKAYDATSHHWVFSESSSG